MQMKMSEEIINVLDYISEKFGVAIDWTNGEIMPYLKEVCSKLIRYEICTSVIWIVISAVLIALCVIFSKKTVKSSNEILDDEDIKITAIIALLLISLLFFAIMIIQIFDIAECCIAPEKYLAEYISELVKNAE